LKKKLISVALAAALGLTGISFIPKAVGKTDGAETVKQTQALSPKLADPGTGKYNYAEALQKSMFFYEVQQAGAKPNWNKVSWHADNMPNDPIPGGWFDAGDHFKFTNTIAYSAMTLAWGFLQYRDGVKATGVEEEYLLNLKWAMDYLALCDLGDEIVYCIQPKGGQFDHQWWGAPEVYMIKYEIMTGNTEREAGVCKDSSIMGQMASTLAFGYLIFKDSDPELANNYLDHAVNLFDNANKNRLLDDTSMLGSMYVLTSFYDDLFMAANVLYKATGEQKYLDLCASDFIPNIPNEGQMNDEVTIGWGYCWDHTWPAGYLLYAENTGIQEWKDNVRKHLETWTGGYKGVEVKYTPDGLAWLFQWGSLRHATATAFIANVACDTIFKDDAAFISKYREFADSQMNYAFGDNASNFSYVIGMDGNDNHSKGWHHRGSSGVWDDKWQALGSGTGAGKEHAHILYGALVGGPDQSGGYSDNPGDYQYTEVAIDYNAGYTAALCSMVSRYGGTIDPNFPPEETPKWDEFYADAKIENGQIKLEIHNHSAWPARTIKNMSFNYFFDATGLDIGSLSGNIGYHGPVIGGRGDKDPVVSGPIQYDGNIYYFKVSFDGTWVLPAGQSEERWEFQVKFDNGTGNPWDSSKDYSAQDILAGSGEVSATGLVKTDKITIYDGDILIAGVEPDGTGPAKTAGTTGDVKTETPKITEGSKVTDETTTTEPEVVMPENPLWGDINTDGQVSVADIVLIARVMAEDETLLGFMDGNPNGYSTVGYALSHAYSKLADLSDPNAKDLVQTILIVSGKIKAA
jgi:hypothetical protein